MALLFAVALFTASALLFLIEPMIGKMLLPYFGGAPAVWNTCLAFFQAALLAGYAYAHALTRWRSSRGQLVVHLAVMVLPWVVLPLVIQPQWAPTGGLNPILPLVGILGLTVAVPFTIVAATTPLLQQWFASTRHRHASDPYFLYAASNAGSMLGLLAYPALVEPYLTLDDQSRAWAVGYAILMVIEAIAIGLVWRQRPNAAHVAQPHSKEVPGAGVLPSFLTRLHWVALAAVPSSLLLGVTAHLSSDVSPVPLIWVAPLALYLMSFMLVFWRLPRWLHRIFAVALPVLVLMQIYELFAAVSRSQHYSIEHQALLHLATFFSAAMVCHGELARRRPTATHLTEYYFWMSLGGGLGGAFNAFLAPLIFNSLIEYPLAMSAACMLSPLVLWRWPVARRWLDLPMAVVVGLLCAVILFQSFGEKRDWPILLSIALCFLTLGRPVIFGLSAAALFLVVGYYHDQTHNLLLRERSFYGVVQVKQDPEFRYLTHGRILHGQQRISDDPAIRDTPLIYYYPTGPLGQLFAAPPPVLESRSPLAVVGLGVGSLAYYGQAEQELTFYEIDPAVERIARDGRYFTYLRDSRADCRVVLGDARLSLREAPSGHYGVIVVDAFSGDAIPVHLLTHEAMQLYLDKLAPEGVLAFHISNQFLDLAPVLGNLAQASDLVGLDQNELAISDEEGAAGKAASHWVILARAREDFGPLTDDTRWHPLLAAPELPLWTDHHTSLWGIANWRK